MLELSHSSSLDLMTDVTEEFSLLKRQTSDMKSGSLWHNQDFRTHNKIIPRILHHWLTPYSLTKQGLKAGAFHYNLTETFINITERVQMLL